MNFDRFTRPTAAAGCIVHLSNQDILAPVLLWIGERVHPVLRKALELFANAALVGAERPKIDSAELTADRLIYVQQLSPSELLARAL